MSNCYLVTTLIVGVVGRELKKQGERCHSIMNEMESECLMCSQ